MQRTNMSHLPGEIFVMKLIHYLQVICCKLIVVYLSEHQINVYVYFPRVCLCGRDWLHRRHRLPRVSQGERRNKNRHDSRNRGHRYVSKRFFISKLNTDLTLFQLLEAFYLYSQSIFGRNLTRQKINSSFILFVCT